MRILVIIPCFDGWIRQELTEVLMEYMVDKRYQKTIAFARGRPLEEALSISAHMAMGGYEDVKDRIKIAYSDFDDFEEGYDFLLVNDADNIPMSNFMEMTEHDKDVCYGCYPIYQHYGQGHAPARWGVLCDKPAQKGLQKVEAGASGAMLIKRKVLEAIPQPIFSREYSDQGRVTRGVDYAFSDKVHEAGFECWVDWDKRAKHWNEIELISMIVGYTNYFTNKQG